MFVCFAVQNSIGSVVNGGTNNVVFQTQGQQINMYLGTQPPIPGATFALSIFFRFPWPLPFPSPLAFGLRLSPFAFRLCLCLFTECEVVTTSEQSLQRVS